METIAYFAGLELLMKQTSNASVKRCSRMWKHILKERALKLYAEMKYKYNECNLSDCLITTETDEEYAEEFAEAIQSKYNWLRQMEIM